MADTSPVSALVRIGRLSLLGRLFEQVLIPPEVASELDDGKAIFGDWRKADGAGHISTRAATNQPLVRELSEALHAGEAAALALAAETSNSFLLIDEMEGRGIAARLGLRQTGTVGLIIGAKRRGLIEAVAPLLAELREKAKLWLSDELVQHALHLAGEKS